MPTSAERGFSTKVAAGLADTNPARLAYLDDCGVVKPSIQEAAGTGTARRWSERDCVLIRLADELRRCGCFGPMLRSVLDDVGSRKNLDNLAVGVTRRGVATVFAANAHPPAEAKTIVWVTAVAKEVADRAARVRENARGGTA